MHIVIRVYQLPSKRLLHGVLTKASSHKWQEKVEGGLEFQPSNSRAYTYSLPQLLNSNWALLYFIVHICRDSYISFLYSYYLEQ